MFWERIYVRLTSGISPLASFICHPQFQEVMKMTYFQECVERDLTPFFKLGKGKQMHSTAWIKQFVGVSTKVLFQYNLLRPLITQFQKHYNVFRSLTGFEDLLFSQDKKKLMSKL